MKRTVTVVFCVLLAAANTVWGGASRKGNIDLTHRYVFIQRNFTKDRHVDDIKKIVRRATLVGYNGVVLSGSFTRIALRDEDYIDRLVRVKAICDEYGMELVPMLFSAGYGSGVLAYNRNLAAGVPVRNLPLVVKGGTGVLVKNSGIGFVNGGFEKFTGDRADGFDLQDLPGELSFVDATQSKSGRSSLRIENVKKKNGGKGRVMQRVTVQQLLLFWLVNY